MNTRRTLWPSMRTTSSARQPRLLFSAAVLATALILQSCSSDVKTETQRADVARAAQQAEDTRLFELAVAGRGDPEVEAANASASGDFRLFSYSLLVPGIFPAAYGVECRPPINDFPALSRATYAASDVPPVNETEAGGRARTSSNHATFGLRYNLTIVADPRFPYRDMCRPTTAQQRLSSDFTSPIDYGFRDLGPLERPTNLAEAARRGTIQSLSALLLSRREELDERDTFGMTPLSWAIAYGRREHAQLLLRSGARALPKPNVVNETDPIRLARDKGWRDMVASMLATLSQKEQEMLFAPPKMKDGNYSFRSELSRLKPSRSSLKDQHARYDVRLQISVAGKATECSIEPKPADALLAKRLCKIVLTKTLWFPARNAFGDWMPGTATLPIVMRSDGN